jgi:hypothetical protein
VSGIGLQIVGKMDEMEHTIFFWRKKIMEGKESLERIFAQLSDEQKEQFKNCKNMDEVMKLADEENVELTDEQLELLGSGGCLGERCTEYRKIMSRKI